MPVQGLSNVFNGPQIPEIGGMATMFNDAFHYGMQRNNLMESQANQLEGQQQELATGGLQAAVANAQNTPEGIATLAAGSQGQAQSLAAKGAYDVATNPDRVQAAIGELQGKIGEQEFDSYSHDIQKAIQTLAANGPTGLTMLDPEMQKIAKIGKSENPIENLMSHLDMLGTVRSIYSPDFKSKAGIESIKSNARIQSTQIKVQGMIDAAKVRAEYAGAAQRGLPQLLSNHEAHVSNENQTYIKTKELINKDPYATPEDKQSRLAELDAQHQKNVDTLNEMHMESLRMLSQGKQNSTQKLEIKPMDGVTLTPDQEQSVANGMKAIESGKWTREQVIAKLQASGIKVQ